MPKPTEHTDASRLPLRQAGQSLPQVRLPFRPVQASAGPPTDSPVKVWTGTEWVSTGINVVLPP